MENLISLANYDKDTLLKLIILKDQQIQLLETEVEMLRKAINVLNICEHN
jgi:hypothetical protein